MTTALGEEVLVPTAGRLFRPSWIDAVNSFVRRLPGPWWAWYGGFFFVELVALLWLSGWGHEVKLGLLCLVAVWTVYPVALIHYLDAVGDTASDRIRPTLDVSDDEFRRLRFALGAMPAAHVLVANLAGMALLWLNVRLSPDLFKGVTPPPGAFQNLLWALLYLNFALQGALVYHSVRQLTLVHHVYGRATRVNFRELSPLYAMAGLAVRTTIAWSLVLAASLLGVPEILKSASATALLFGLAVVALLGAVLPLSGIHRRLEEEKGRRVAEAEQHVQLAVDLLYRCAREEDFAKSDAASKLLTSLLSAKQLQEKLPTWPWQPGTAAALFSAILLPLALRLVQNVIDTLMH